MQSFKSYQAEQEEILVEETAGHKYQMALKDQILNALTPQQKSNITILVAEPSSTLPDIQIIHKKYPDEPLIIECKMNRAQSGAIVWQYNGSQWNFYPSDRAKQVCEVDDPSLCALVFDMIKSPLIRNRIDKIQSELGNWFPELKSNTVPFSANKEFWPTLLDKYTTKDAGGNWQMPLQTQTFWKNLNSIMHGDHFLHIKGSGMFRVGGAKLPKWFGASEAFLSKMSVLSEVTDTPKGNLELRLKQSGMSRKKVQQRELHIQSTKQPNVGDNIFVKELGKMGKEANYNNPIGLFNTKGKATYIIGSTDKGSIGKIGKIDSVSKVGNDWVVKCDFEHRVGTISFETNLRITDVSAKSGVNLENNADVTNFVSFIP